MIDKKHLNDAVIRNYIAMSYGKSLITALT